MSNTVSRLLEIARGEIGYHEKNNDNNLDSKTASNDGNGNHTKYARDLHAAGYYNGNKCGYAWCDVFVDWLFYQLAGKNAAKAQEIECQTGPYGAGCEWSARYYKQAGRYYTSGPQAGDQIFFGDFDHTGIVEAVNGSTITTIEGNSNNRVERRTYSINSSYITGFGRPRYEPENNKEDPEMNETAIKKMCEECARAALQAAMDGTGTGDAHGDWANEATAWATQSGIVAGFGDGNMGWKKLLTREQFAVMLYRFAKMIGKA
jgi:hypothetical protein